MLGMLLSIHGGPRVSFQECALGLCPWLIHFTGYLPLPGTGTSLSWSHVEIECFHFLSLGYQPRQHFQICSLASFSPIYNSKLTWHFKQMESDGIQPEWQERWQ